MRATKDSGIEWIGQIPQEWETKKLKFLVNLRTDKTADKTVPAPYVGLEHVASSAGTLIEDYEAILDFVGDTLDFKAGDVLFGKLRPYLAKAIHAETDGRCSSEFWVMDPQSIDGRFLLYAVLSHGFISCIDQSTFGVKMPRAEWEYAGNQELALPDSDTQRRIAEYLDAKCADIDALIAAKEKTNALLKERRQSIIYEAVTKGLNPDAPMKDSGIEWIGEIPEHWEVERLKHHIEFNPKTEIPEYGEDDSVSFIPMDCLRRGVHTSQTVDYSKVKSGYVDFAERDILMAKVTPCLENGNLAIAGNLIDGVGFGSTEINVIRCKSIHREYLFYILQCKTYVDRAVADMYGVAGLKRLNPSFIPNTKYPMPSIEEQQGIAEHLASTCSEIDELVAANERTIEKLKEYRQSVIYEAVTGKIEI